MDTVDPATLTAGYLPALVRKAEDNSWFFFSFMRTKSKTSRKNPAKLCSRMPPSKTFGVPVTSQPQ
jgi:hypothetical protein